MKLQTLLLLAITLNCQTLLAEDAFKLSETKAPPKGIARDQAAAVQATGLQVNNNKGTVCTIWLTKTPAIKEKFTPGLGVNYGFTVGDFMGVMEVGKAATFTDFRGQEIAPGVYTLRYMLQPEDGNHIGTSELRDFLIALPIAKDKTAKTINLIDELNQKSAAAAGSTHPAIFSMLPVEKTPKASKLEHNEDNAFWILSTGSMMNAKQKPVPLRMVIIGKSDV